MLSIVPICVAISIGLAFKISGEYELTLCSTFVPLCVWMWLQWPRRLFSYICLIATVIIVSIPLLMDWMLSALGQVAFYFPDDKVGYVSFLAASLSTMFLRCVVRWRLVDSVSDHDSPDETSRASIKEAMIATLFSSLLLLIWKSDVEALRENGVNDIPWYQCATAFWTLFFSCQTLCIILVFRLTSRTRLRSIFVGILPITICVAVFHWGLGQAAVWTLGEIPWWVRSLDDVRDFMNSPVMPLAGTVVVMGFVVSCRSVNLSLASTSGEGEGITNTAMVRALQTLLFAAVAFLLLFNAFATSGFANASDTFIEGSRGWPLIHEAWWTDSMGTRIVRQSTRSANLLNVGFALIIAATVVWIIPRMIATGLKMTATRMGLRRVGLANGLQILVLISALGGLTAFQSLSLYDKYESLSAAALCGSDADYGPGWGGTRLSVRGDEISTNQEKLVLRPLSAVQHRFGQLLRTGELTTGSLRSVHLPTMIEISGPTSQQQMDCISQNDWVRQLSISGGVPSESILQLLGNKNLSSYSNLSSLTPQQATDRLKRMSRLDRCSLISETFPNLSRESDDRIKTLSVKVVSAGGRLTLPKTLSSLTLEIASPSQKVTISGTPVLDYCDLAFRNGDCSVVLEDGSAGIIVLVRTAGRLSLQTGDSCAPSAVKVWNLLSNERERNPSELARNPSSVDLDIRDASLLQLLDLDNTNLASLQFQQLPSQLMLYRTAISLSNEQFINELKMLPKTLTRLNIDANGLSSSILPKLSRFRSLDSIRIHFEKPNPPQRLSVLPGHFPSLQEFNTPNWSIDEEGLSELTQAAPVLQTLTVNGANLRIADLRSVGALTQLCVMAPSAIQSLRLGKVCPDSIQLDLTELEKSYLQSGTHVLRGESVTKQNIESLLDNQPTGMIIGRLIDANKVLHGVDFGSLEYLAIEDNLPSPKTIRSWKFNPSVSPVGGTPIMRLEMTGEGELTGDHLAAINEVIPGIDTANLARQDQSQIWMESKSLSIANRKVTPELIAAVEQSSFNEVIVVDCTFEGCSMEDFSENSYRVEDGYSP